MLSSTRKIYAPTALDVLYGFDSHTQSTTASLTFNSGQNLLFGPKALIRMATGHRLAHFLCRPETISLERPRSRASHVRYYLVRTWAFASTLSATAI